MKHTLKAKYAANGLNAHRQRVIANAPAEVARQREAARRQEVVDRVTARLSQPARPKYDNLKIATMFSAAALANMRASILRMNATKPYFLVMSSGMLEELKSFKPERADDRVDAMKYAFLSAPRCVGKRPDVLILDDIACR